MMQWWRQTRSRDTETDTVDVYHYSQFQFVPSGSVDTSQLRSTCYRPRRYPIKAARRRIDFVDILYRQRGTESGPQFFSDAARRSWEMLRISLRRRRSTMVAFVCRPRGSVLLLLRSAVSCQQPNPAERWGLLIMEIERRRDRAWHCGTPNVPRRPRPQRAAALPPPSPPPPPARPVPLRVSMMMMLLVFTTLGGKSRDGCL